MSNSVIVRFLILIQALILSTHPVDAQRPKRAKGRSLRGSAECLGSALDSVLGGASESNGNNKGGNRRRERNLRFFNAVTGLYDAIVGVNNDTDTGTETESGNYYDVVIIGAGMAGMAAAVELQATDPDLTYIILESSGRTGGRVRSHTMGVAGKQVVVEDGANWIIPFNDNPLWIRAQAMGLKGMTNDWHDWTVYNASGNLEDVNLVATELKKFEQAFAKAGKDADGQWTSNHENYDDRGVLAALADNGWAVAADSTGDLDYLMQWSFIDFEYAVADVSERYFPYAENSPYLVTDQRGYSSVLDAFRDENIPADRILLNSRVTSVDYSQNNCTEECLGVCLGTSYKALVKTATGTEYYAQRVISTVSVGVLNSDLIAFNPPLAYPHSEYNPYYMAAYIKIFYQFPAQFWDSTQFTEITRDPAHRGHCHHWQNMELAIPGSAIIRCELMTEAFKKLIDPDTLELSAATLSSLLDPLRTVYGAETVGTPLDVYYPKLNKDADFGFGAYGAWKIGYSFTKFAKFFGGVEELTPYCEHNGCNGDGDWVLYLGGSASCYDSSEFVHGAYFSGQRSAKHALKSMGYDVETSHKACDQWWGDLT